MNKESLKEYLSSRYQGWSSFLNNVIFPIFGEDDFEDGYDGLRDKYLEKIRAFVGEKLK